MPFHIVISTRSDRSHDEVKLDLALDQLERQYLGPYRAGRPIVIRGRTIPLGDITRIRVFSTEQSSDHILPIVRAERAGSLVVTPIPDEWYVARKGKDVTDDFISSPPGGGEMTMSNVASTQSKAALDVLVSWSGLASHEIALFLRDWLPEVLPGCDPWVSSEDIAKGKRWSDELHRFLTNARVAVVCVTPANVNSPWLYYEAGFIAAKLGEASVCPFLVGVEGRLVQGTPLGQYQWTEAKRDDTYKLLRTLNGQLPNPHHESMLEGNFRSKWPQLDRRLLRVATKSGPATQMVEQTVPSVADRMSEEAKKLLIAACTSKSDEGGIMMDRDSEGDHITVGDQEMCHPTSSREVATWKGALEELRNLKLVHPPHPGGIRFEVTREGWKEYDRLAAASAE